MSTGLIAEPASRPLDENWTIAATALATRNLRRAMTIAERNVGPIA